MSPIYVGTGPGQSVLVKAYRGIGGGASEEIQIAEKAAPTGGTTPPVDPAATNNLYWAARITHAYYQANYGSTDPNDAPTSTQNWDLFEKHNTSVSGTTIGKRVAAIQWGNGVATSWPAAGTFNNSNTFLIANDNACKNRNAFSQWVWGIRGVPLTEILNNTDVAKIHLGHLYQGCKDAKRPMLHPIYWEFNGNWYAWGRDQNATAHGLSTELGTTLAARQANYITMFRNQVQILMDIMSAPRTGPASPYYGPTGTPVWGQGTHTGNVSVGWLANIFVSGGNVPNPTPWFPGAAYVSWIGFDGYQTSTTLYQSPSALYDQTYNALAALPGNKPMFIGEFGVARNTPSPFKEGWFKNFYEVWLPAHPRVKHVNYFNDQGTNNDDPFIEAGRAAAPDASRLEWVNQILKPNIVGGPTGSWGTTYDNKPLPIP